MPCARRDHERTRCRRQSRGNCRATGDCRYWVRIPNLLMQKSKRKEGEEMVASFTWTVSVGRHGPHRRASRIDGNRDVKHSLRNVELISLNPQSTQDGSPRIAVDLQP